MSRKLRNAIEEIFEVLTRNGDDFATSLMRRTKQQQDEIDSIIRAIRDGDDIDLTRPRRNPDGSQHPNAPNADVEGIDMPRAEYGDADGHHNYRDNFFEEHPDISRDDVVVHHATEQQINDRFPSDPPLVSPDEMHSPENLRGIPRDVNDELHLSAIRAAWNRFYDSFPEGVTPTRAQIQEYATLVDDVFGHLFVPPIRSATTP